MSTEQSLKELPTADLPETEDTHEHIEDTAITTRHLHVSLRGVLATLVVLTVCFMSLYGLEVKEPLYTLSAMTVGWYFGRQPQKKMT